MKTGDSETGSQIPKGVIGKLQKYKASREGTETITLPLTGVVVTYPGFRSHGQWQRSMRRNKGNVGKAQIDYLTAICLFDDERVTVADFDEFIPMEDANDLLAAVFVGEDEDDAGEN